MILNAESTSNSLEQSLSLEVNSSPAGEEIPRNLWKPMVHYRVYKIPPLAHILGQSSSARAVPIDLRSILITSSNIPLCFHLSRDLSLRTCA